MSLRKAPICFVLAAAMCGATPAGAAPAVDRDAGRTAQGAFVPGEAIVRFERGVGPADRLAARRAAGVKLGRALEIPNAQVVEVEGGVRAAVRRLEQQPDVAFAQPNFVYRALATQLNDTFAASLWGLTDPTVPNPGVNALAAWDGARGAGQVVAVVDTGVALDHPDLVGNLWTNPDETSGGGDDDANGHGDDVDGFDFVDDDTDPDDYNFHGTHVAGTIAATANNSLGVAGVAPEAQIMPVRVLDGDGSGNTADVAAGIDYAAREGADVINLSLGGGAGPADLLVSKAIDEANARDAVVVAAAGNEATDNDVVPSTPCTMPQPNVICVAAVNQGGNLAGFSNYGVTTVDVGGPGTAILSTETDYDQLGATEGFNTAGIPGWTKFTAPGSIAWDTSTVRSEGALSAADSPAPGQNYAPNSNTQLIKTTPVDLTGRAGCRMHFDLRYEIENAVDENGFLYDSLFAGAVGGAGLEQDGYEIAGSSGGFFEATEVSVSDLDGLSDVQPAFALFSDATVQFDGAYLDNLRILCRASTYSNASPPTGNYVSFQGTSMATPHVAGVAALVRDAVPTASDTDIANAIKRGGVPLASLQGKTTTGCTVDAMGAISIAAGGADPNRCPAPAPASRPPDPPAPAVPSAPAPPPAPPAPDVDLSGAKAKVRVSSTRRFGYVFRATAGLAGEASFRIRGGARISHKPFTAASTGRVRVVVRLTRRQLHVLRRRHRLVLRVTAVQHNGVGQIDRATKRLTLLPPRR